MDRAQRRPTQEAYDRCLGTKTSRGAVEICHRQRGHRRRNHQGRRLITRSAFPGARQLRGSRMRTEMTVGLNAV